MPDRHLPTAMPGPPSAPALRTALGRYATGVAIVTCQGPDGQAVGLTCNSFASVSLSPPLVLWSLRLHSPSLAAFDAAGHFAVNVLADDQVALSRRFASSVADKFAQGSWLPGLDGMPVLGGSAAVFECSLESRQLAGDHVLYIGRVQRMAERAAPPLLFQGGQYHSLGGPL